MSEICLSPKVIFQDNYPIKYGMAVEVIQGFSYKQLLKKLYKIRGESEKDRERENT